MTTETIENLLNEFATAYDFIGGLEDEDQRYLGLLDEFIGRIKKMFATENAELLSKLAEESADAVVYKGMVDDLRIALSGHAKSVYVVMESDDLMTEGIPMVAFWDAESATRCSHERQHKDEDGIMHYSWVQEVKVVAHE